MKPVPVEAEVGVKSMKDLSGLLDQLNRTINDALWDSEPFLDAVAALEEAVGNFRISIDVLLAAPNGSPPGSEQPESEAAESDTEFLRSLKIDPLH
jgi:hypothetical protein